LRQYKRYKSIIQNLYLKEVARILIFLYINLILSGAMAAGDPVLVGAGLRQDDENRNFLSTSQNHYFGQQEDKYGNSRYGWGRGSLEVDGKYLGINLSARNGILHNINETGFLYDYDIFSGNFVLNSDKQVNSYYMYLPALGIGYQFKTDWFKLMGQLKYGSNITNLYRTGPIPDVNSMNGISLNLDLDEFSLGYDRSFSQGTHFDQLMVIVEIRGVLVGYYQQYIDKHRNDQIMLDLNF
jgi:hypothetical protein